MRGLCKRGADTRHCADRVGAGAQVRDAAQELQRVPLLLQRVRPRVARACMHTSHASVWGHVQHRVRGGHDK